MKPAVIKPLICFGGTISAVTIATFQKGNIINVTFFKKENTIKNINMKETN